MHKTERERGQCMDKTETDTQTERNRQTQRETETERETQRDRETDGQRDRGQCMEKTSKKQTKKQKQKHKKSCAVRHLALQTTAEESIGAIGKEDKKADCVVRFEHRWILCKLGHQSDHHSCRKRENSNSKTLCYKDCSLGSFKNLTTRPS